MWVHLERYTYIYIWWWLYTVVVAVAKLPIQYSVLPYEKPRLTMEVSSSSSQTCHDAFGGCRIYAYFIAEPPHFSSS